MPLNKPFDEIGEADIHELIARQEAESKTLDYKQSAIGSKDSDKKEFLADVSSFANASGGYLFIGIEEKEGVPISIPGLPSIDPDREIARLENLCRDGIDRRIPGLRMKAVPVEGKSPVLLINVPRSWAKLHMVKHQGHNKFYSRNSNGKHILDVEEIRSGFLASEAAGERLRRFRIERVASIEAGETPVATDPGPTMAFHLVPFSSSDSTIMFDVGRLHSGWKDPRGRWGQYSPVQLRRFAVLRS